MTRRAEVGGIRRVSLRAGRPNVFDALATLAAIALLATVLAPGLVLSYDMVWVPDLAVSAAGWGLVDGVPRAVPSDQVVALLDTVVPGALLQKAILLSALIGAGAGLHRVVSHAPPAGRCLAAVLGVWNPYVVERLLIGHWPLLIAYAVLPWLVLAGRRAALRGTIPASVPILVVLGSLSASGGVMTAIGAALFVGYAGGLAARNGVLLAGIVAGANAPWIVAGALSAGAARADAAGALAAAEAFAAHPRPGVPVVIAVLGGGGIWNDQTAAPYDAVRAWAWAVLVGGGLCALAWRLVVAARRRSATGGAPDPGAAAMAHEREGVAALLAAGLALAVAVQSAWVPAFGAVLAQHVPGGGLFRDATRIEALLFPAAALGWAAISGRFTPRRRGAPVLVASLVAALVPVALLPGGFNGVGGELRAVTLPTAYADLADTIRLDSDATRPVVLSLPYASYRAPSWNHDRPVLDPVPRLVGDAEVIASDALYVSGVLVSGEDPYREEVLAALGREDAEQRSEALRRLGVTHVARARGSDVDGAPAQLNPTLAGEQIVDAELEVIRLAGPAAGPAATRPVSDRLLLGVAWMVYFAVAFILPLAIRRRTAHRSASSRS